MHLSSLHLYPIKSCRGHSVEQLTIDALGPVGDRRLMLVNERGRFLSQREIPALATITPHLADEELTAEVEGQAPLRHFLASTGPTRSVSVWGSEGLEAIDQGDEAAAWFSSAIRHPCRLVRFGPMTHNPVDPQYAPRPDSETAFTDGYPVLAVTEASLEDLNSRLEQPVPMNRFRPSVVVRGATAWGEDAWREVRIGEMVWDAVKPCARCVMTTTDQASGERHPTQEPLRTLATFRTVSGLGAIFGQNMVHRSSGVIRVGDPVVPA